MYHLRKVLLINFLLVLHDLYNEHLFVALHGTWHTAFKQSIKKFYQKYSIATKSVDPIFGAGEDSKADAIRTQTKPTARANIIGLATRTQMQLAQIGYTTQIPLKSIGQEVGHS